MPSRRDYMGSKTNDPKHLGGIRQTMKQIAWEICFEQYNNTEWYTC